MNQIEVTPMGEFNFESVAAHSRRVGAGRTIVTDGDSLAREIAKTRRWAGSGRLSVLIMREFAQSEKSHIKMKSKDLAKRLIYTRASSATGVDLAVLKSAVWAGKSKFRVAMDPVELSTTAEDIARIRQEWDLNPSIYWFAVLGAITERKNVPLIAQALMTTDTNDVGLLVAGKIESSIKSAVYDSLTHLSKAGKSVKIVDALLTDTDLDAAVSAADCLVLAHSNEGPSGLLGKAAAAGTRVVAAGAMSLREDVEALGNSGQWAPLEVHPLSRTLNRARSIPRNSVTLNGTTSSFLEALLPDD
ncbi:glycosyltransferase [Pseudarthrobacter oxydans]|uniref:glycosyltransferase n=1 Tax=Pseudarthrobacter oxydans TaxID=1671 RepID=UPI00380412E1